MKKRTPVFLALGLLCYVLLLGLLLAAESADPQAGIRSFGDALWFSLVTLTTVGYGDLYPVTPVGRALGLLFLLFSAGLLASLLGAAVSFLHGRALPRLRLGRLRGKQCCVFSETNALSCALARNLLRREPKAYMLFCRSDQPDGSGTLPASRRVVCLPQDAAEAARAVCGLGSVSVFLMGDSEAENYAAAQALCSLPLQCVCRGPETGGLPGVRFFDEASCTAQAYWQARPLKAAERTVVLAGSGRLAQALLDQAVLVNSRVPFAVTDYHLFGDWAEYRRDHPALSRVFAAEPGGDSRDALLFHDDAWNAQPALLEQSGRIVFCGDDPAENAGKAARLIRCFPLRGEVHAAAPAVAAPGIAFGRPEEICTEDTVLRSGLDARARALHALYCRATGKDEPWDGLSPFLKASNRASADHLLTKLSLLLPERDAVQLSPKACREAARRWEALPDREPFRRNEHDRWMRFYALYNWRRGPEKDSARRTHPCLVPYDDLPPEEREKDDNAWIQIGSLGTEGAAEP